MHDEPLLDIFSLTDIELIRLSVIDGIDNEHIADPLLYLRQLAESYLGMVRQNASIRRFYWQDQ